MDEEMKGKGISESARRFLATLAMLGILGITAPSIAPTTAWGRIAPVTTVSGDPDDPESPSLGPKKAAQSATTSASYIGAPKRNPEGAQDLWWLAWRSILIQVLRFERL
jgi:hypothetical protein